MKHYRFGTKQFPWGKQLSLQSLITNPGAGFPARGMKSQALERHLVVEIYVFFSFQFDSLLPPIGILSYEID